MVHRRPPAPAAATRSLAAIIIACAAILACPAPAAADTVVLQNGTRLHGDVEEVDGRVLLHLPDGTVEFERDELKEGDAGIERGDTMALTTPPYTNPLLGYLVTSPRDYSIVANPAHPSTDVMMFARETSGALSVSVLSPDLGVDPTTDDMQATLDATARSWSAFYANINAERHEVFQYRGHQAWRMRWRFTERWNGETAVLERVYVRVGDRIFRLDLGVYAEDWEDEQDAFEEMLEVWRPLTPRGATPGRINRFEWSYAAVLPDGWSGEVAGLQGGDRLVMTGEPGVVQVDVTVAEDRPDIATLRERRRQALEADPPAGFRWITDRSGNEFGRVVAVAEWVRDGEDGPEQVRELMFVFDGKNFTVRLIAPEEGAGEAFFAMKPALEGVRLLRNLEAKAGLEAADKAVDASEAGLGALVARKWDEARGHYNDALEAYPEFAEAHFFLGMIALENDQWDEALEHVETARDLLPEATWYSDSVAELHLIKAGEHYDAGRIRQCHRECKAAAGALSHQAGVETRRRVIDYLLGVSNHYVREDRLNKADNPIRDAARVAGRDDDLRRRVAGAWAGLAGHHARVENDLDEAIDLMRRAVDLAEDDPGLRRSYATLLYNKAVEAFNEGDDGKARSYCKKALGVDETHNPARQLLKRMDERR